MRIVVDTNSCLGYGVCASHSEQIFAVDDGVARVLIDPIPADLTELAQTAIAECPASALSAIDES